MLTFSHLNDQQISPHGKPLEQLINQLSFVTKIEKCTFLRIYAKCHFYVLIDNISKMKISIKDNMMLVIVKTMGLVIFGFEIENEHCLSNSPINL